MEDVKIMGAASEIWEHGTALMRKMLAEVPESKRFSAVFLLSWDELQNQRIPDNWTGSSFAHGPYAAWHDPDDERISPRNRPMTDQSLV